MKGLADGSQKENQAVVEAASSLAHGQSIGLVFLGA
jgi:hypothetical protein